MEHPKTRLDELLNSPILVRYLHDLLEEAWEAGYDRAEWENHNRSYDIPCPGPESFEGWWHGTP